MSLYWWPLCRCAFHLAMPNGLCWCHDCRYHPHQQNSIAHRHRCRWMHHYRRHYCSVDRDRCAFDRCHPCATPAVGRPDPAGAATVAAAAHLSVYLVAVPVRPAANGMAAKFAINSFCADWMCPGGCLPLRHASVYWQALRFCLLMHHPIRLHTAIVVRRHDPPGSRSNTRCPCSDRCEMANCPRRYCILTPGQRSKCLVRCHGPAHGLSLNSLSRPPIFASLGPDTIWAAYLDIVIAVDYDL